MKKFYLLLVVLMGFGSVSGQNPTDIINIPDPVFKAKLINESQYFVTTNNGEFITIDTNNDSEIQVSEAQNIGRITLNWAEGITSLEGIASFPNLKRLSCMGIDITSLDVTGVTNLEKLNVDSCNLSTLNVEGLFFLKELLCGNNSISDLNLAGLVNLQTLDCSYNSISELNMTGLPKLSDFSCFGNQIITLDVTALPLLKDLECGSNGMTTLNVSGLTKLWTLKCSDNLLSTIDEVTMKKLKSFNCSDNLFTSLNFLNSTSILTVNCGSNQISSISFAGTPLVSLDCPNNLFTTLNLENLPNLGGLDCSGNQLTTLDISNLPLLSSLNVSNNQLQTLFIKNGKYQTGQSNYYMGNPDLIYICADENEIEAFTEQALFANCEINSYCSFTPGEAFYRIDGTSTLDSNANGCDDTDMIFPNLKFNATDGVATGSFIANELGNYSIPVSTGTHILTPVLENPTFFNISPATATITFPDTTSPFIQNFCITQNGIHPDLEVTIVPTTPARPGFDADYKLVIKNKGNIQQSGSVNFTYNDAVLDYLSANPLATTQTTGAMTWDFANLQPFETREITLTLNVNSPMETPAVNGDDILNYTATITSAATDVLPLDNTFSLPQIVVNSFDPNDKTCLEGTSITSDMIGKYVHYMIRFENTGTFPAEIIVVKDMIDATKFDVASLIPLNASHDYVTRISGNKVEFIFENINLPFDDATNDGYIVFKIKTLPTLVLGDSFSNSASIYFDYNFPIVTDPAVTTFAVLGTEDFVFNNYLTVYPNPTKDILNITSKQSIELKSMEVYNILGQIVLSIPNANGVDKVDVSNLNAGTYFLKVSSDKGTSNVKFIKN